MSKFLTYSGSFPRIFPFGKRHAPRPPNASVNPIYCISSNPTKHYSDRKVGLRLPTSPATPQQSTPRNIFASVATTTSVPLHLREGVKLHRFAGFHSTRAPSSPPVLLKTAVLRSQSIRAPPPKSAVFSSATLLRPHYADQLIPSTLRRSHSFRTTQTGLFRSTYSNRPKT